MVSTASRIFCTNFNRHFIALVCIIDTINLKRLNCLLIIEN